MATRAKTDTFEDDFEEMRSLLLQLAESLKLEDEAHKRLVARAREFEREGERQRQILASL